MLTDGDGGTSPPATRVISVSAANDAPVNTVPGGQAVNEDVTPTVSSERRRRDQVTDVDASGLQVTLGVTTGTLTLSGTAGLVFSAGGGTADASMTFSGTQAAATRR